MYCASASVVRPGGCGGTSVDSVENEPPLVSPTLHLVGCLAVPGASATGEVKALMESGSDITAESEELVEALRGQPRMT